MSEASPAPRTWSGRRLVLIVVVAGLVIGLDHLTKWLVARSIAIGEEVPAHGVVTLHHTENAGAAFGLFPQFTELYPVIAGIVAAYILLAGPRVATTPFRQLVLGCILGGAVSNAIDRVASGHVTDFIDFHFWPVFNVADMAIVGGMLFAVITMTGTRQHPAEPADGGA